MSSGLNPCYRTDLHVRHAWGGIDPYICPGVYTEPAFPKPATDVKKPAQFDLKTGFLPDYDDTFLRLQEELDQHRNQHIRQVNEAVDKFAQECADRLGISLEEFAKDYKLTMEPQTIKPQPDDNQYRFETIIRVRRRIDT